MGRKGSSSMSGGGGGRGNPVNNGVTWDTQGTMKFLQDELDKYGLGISKERLTEQMYRAARNNGGDVYTVNDRYLAVNGKNGIVEFQFIKSNAEGKWKLSPITGYRDITTGMHNGARMYYVQGKWFANKIAAEIEFVRSKLG